MHQLRTIALFNVTYKLVTMILVHRFRPFLGDLIGPFQSSFLLGKNTTDNILILQEVTTRLWKKKGKKGSMLYKFDLEKDMINSNGIHSIYSI